MKTVFHVRHANGVAAGIVLVGVMGILSATDISQAGRAESFPEVIKAAGARGGLIIHLGCGDGSLAAALGEQGLCLVHGLDDDPHQVRAARRHIQSHGFYGRVSVEQWDREYLPYIDNVANLIVAEDRMGVPETELVRVLCPGGMAAVKSDGQWHTIRKPWPRDVDEWTHFLHDASGNAVSRDFVAGPPRRMQWVATPRWSRNHHKLASVSSVVSAGGRLFYIADEATPGSMLVPGRWFVAARDAFNGVLLWKRPMSSWAWEGQAFRAGPVQLPRLLVSTGDRVYVPLGMNQAISAIDAVTGKTLATYEQTEGAEEIIFEDGVLLVVRGKPMAEQAAIHPDWHDQKSFKGTKSIVAIRERDGEQLWTWQEDGSLPVMPLTLAAADDRVFFQVGEGIVCRGLAGGELLWTGGSSPRGVESNRPGRSKRGKAGRGLFNQWKRKVGWSTATLVVHDDVVLWADRNELKALSVRDGHLLWRCPCKVGFKSPTDVLVAAGLVWVGPEYNVGRDLHSGEVKRRLPALDDLRTVGHHHRCYREKATDRYIIGGYRGMEFFDLVGENHSRNNWTRGTCPYGILPCNGLVYAPPHACGCYMEAKLYGFWALAPEAATVQASVGRSRLEKGRAWGETSSWPANRVAYAAAAWPTYRHDALRSGSTPTTVPPTLKPQWQARVGDRISPPVAVEDTVLLSAIDEHRVFALATQDGSLRWTFTAGGRVDSPPTLYAGLVLFGSADGCVYCLRLDDGEVVWRFRAAPQDLRTVACDRVESVWPVHGSVLVLGGVAYAAAGRSSYLDGGIYMYGLDPRTGAVLYQKRVQSAHPQADEGRAGPPGMTKKLTQNMTDPKTFQAPDLSDAFSMKGGVTTDVLASDGTSVFLRTLRFDKELRQQEKARHLFSTSSLLDGHENHRSHWLIGIGDFSRMPVAYSWIANRPGNYGSDVAVPYGLMLAFDENRVWGVRRLEGYTLYADRFEPFTGRDEQRPDVRVVSSEETPSWTWSKTVEIRPRAFVRAADTLLLGGTPVLAEGQNGPEAFAEFEGRGKGLLWIMSAEEGRRLQSLSLAAPPVWDGMAVAHGKLYVSRVDGVVECWGPEAASPR